MMPRLTPDVILPMTPMIRRRFRHYRRRREPRGEEAR